MLRFEYDIKKSSANAQKHGVDFEAAKELWDDEWLVFAPLPYKAEKRFAATGQFRGKCWTAIFTYRGSSIRLISFRRAHKKEENLYEEHNRRRA